METNTQSTYKRIYQFPAIERIILDNEISLQLESYNSPPTRETNNNLNSLDYFSNDPMKTDLG